MDSDGDPDIVGSNLGWPTLVVFMNRGDMTLTAPARYGAEIGNVNLVWIAIGDFDNNGHLDGAMATGLDGKIAVFGAVR